VQEITSEIDPISLSLRAKHPNRLRPGGVGEIRFESLEAFPLERYSETPQLGRFVVMGGKGAIGAGIVVGLESICHSSHSA